jgi:predicted transcriptional regulator
MKYIIYYDKKTETISEYFPKDLSEQVKQTILEVWAQPICKEILKLLTNNDEITAPFIQEQIGHSMSTLHDAVKRLELAELIDTQMIYKQNKQNFYSGLRSRRFNYKQRDGFN